MIYAKDHQLPLINSSSQDAIASASLICTDDGQANEDELYFISCGGIY